MNKSEAFLKLIILYKTVTGIMEIVLSVSFLRFFNSNHADPFTRLALRLGLDSDNRLVGALLKKAGALHKSTVVGLTLVVLIFGIFNLVESYGLHLRRRWAELLTVYATALLIPFELYEVVRDITALNTAVLVVNSAIVYYLAKHKELFKKA